MVWSPPIASRCAAPASSPAAAASIWSTASLMSNGLHAMSPASATCWVPNGATRRPGCHGRSSREPCRTADGPNRAPGRYDVPLSNGTPTTATSQRVTSSRRGSIANVGGPAKRGVRLASMGPRTARSAPPGAPSVPVNDTSPPMPGGEKPCVMHNEQWRRRAIVPATDLGLVLGLAHNLRWDHAAGRRDPGRGPAALPRAAAAPGRRRAGHVAAGGVGARERARGPDSLALRLGDDHDDRDRHPRQRQTAARLPRAPRRRRGGVPGLVRAAVRAPADQGVPGHRRRARLRGGGGAPRGAVHGDLAGGRRGGAGRHRPAAQRAAAGLRRGPVAGRREPEHPGDLRPARAAVRLPAVRLHDAAGPAAGRGPRPAARQAKLMPDTPASPPTVPGGYVLPVSGPRGTVGYILAMEAAGAAPAGVSVVQHIATVAALQLSMHA